ncbi:uncharacterized protein LOC130706172 [Balaenoptera acutorostrata]|uniref:Uncharacterized protein LOC130706172 n=1 Tax=Balaenoptera acutorostrata TaxID=9767 RepID=A0ABM3SUF6_BALAC|nr:uncharacterized protein LOC130706172 [Balaenoptera acutorostrata]
MVSVPARPRFPRAPLGGSAPPPASPTPDPAGAAPASHAPGASRTRRGIYPSARSHARSRRRSFLPRRNSTRLSLAAGLPVRGVRAMTPRQGSGISQQLQQPTPFQETSECPGRPSDTARNRLGPTLVPRLVMASTRICAELVRPRKLPSRGYEPQLPPPPADTPDSQVCGTKGSGAVSSAFPRGNAEQASYPHELQFHQLKNEDSALLRGWLSGINKGFNLTQSTRYRSSRAGPQQRSFCLCVL